MTCKDIECIVGCVLQDFADAVFHLVREKYGELIGCSALMHACHKGLAGIVMTRGRLHISDTGAEMSNKEATISGTETGIFDYSYRARNV